MTVQEFVDVVTKNPNFLKEQLCVVTGAEKVVGGQFDGAAMVRSRPVQSVSIGTYGLLLFADPNIEKQDAFMADVTRYPGIVIVGPIPDALKI